MIEITLWFLFLWLCLFLFLKKSSSNSSSNKNNKSNSSEKWKKDEKKTRKIEVGVFLGSGGHTYEMLEILKVLQKGRKLYKYKSLFFLFFYTTNDIISKIKAEQLGLYNEKENTNSKKENSDPSSDSSVDSKKGKFTKGEKVTIQKREEQKEKKGKSKRENTEKKEKKEMQFISLPRCRNVGESFIVSFVKFFFIFFYCLVLTFNININILLVNGPGICLPVVFSFFFKNLLFLGKGKTKIVYIESITRIHSLSLTGKIVYFFSDHFIVFSENLRKKYKKAKYYGYLF